MTETNPAAQAIEARLLEAASRWKFCEGLPESDLLRLAVLRDLVHGLHAEKSRFLAHGQRESASSIRTIEDRIEDMRNCKPLSGDLETLLSGTALGLKKRTRILPDSVFASLDREKFERYDRQWEAALASEGISIGWKIWALEACIDVPQIDAWHKTLTEQLWPHGIVLFVESARDNAISSTSAWLARWIMTLHSKFQDPSDMGLDFSKWPGTSSTPSWRLLFSPKST